MTDIVAWLQRIAKFDTPADPRKACKEAADEILRLRSEQAHKWQPIETAPKAPLMVFTLTKHRNL